MCRNCLGKVIILNRAKNLGQFGKGLGSFASLFLMDTFFNFKDLTIDFDSLNHVAKVN